MSFLSSQSYNHRFHIVDPILSGLNMSATSITMKAVHYEKPFQVSVREVPLPKIEHPDDAIIKVTTAGMSPSGEWEQDAHVHCQQSAAQTCTCTKDEQLLRRALFSVRS